MSELELKPCPFCGGIAFPHKEYYEDYEERPVVFNEIVAVGMNPMTYTQKARISKGKICVGWLIECEDCGARGAIEYKDPIQTREEAAELWNVRHTEDGDYT